MRGRWVQQSCVANGGGVGPIHGHPQAIGTCIAKSVRCRRIARGYHEPYIVYLAVFWISKTLVQCRYAYCTPEVTVLSKFISARLPCEAICVRQCFKLEVDHSPTYETNHSWNAFLLKISSIQT